MRKQPVALTVLVFMPLLSAGPVRTRRDSDRSRRVAINTFTDSHTGGTQSLIGDACSWSDAGGSLKFAEVPRPSFSES